MTATPSPTRLVMLLLVLALVAAACRSSDDGDDAAQETETTEEASDEDTEEGDATPADEATSEEDGGEVAASGPGVTEEPCPEAVNPDNGCIYLGVMSDFTEGPFSAAGPLIQEAQEAFFRRVNEAGGIAGHDIDVTTHVRDNLYAPETQAQVFEEIRGEILAVALSLGSSPTLAIIDDLRSENLLTVPGAWNSDFAFEDIVAESGNNYCVESMNAIDYYMQSSDAEGGTVMAIHYPNDYGQDGSVGARLAAEAHGMEFVSVPTPPGADNQTEAIQAVVSQNPEVVLLTVAPAETAAIVGQAAAQGYQGRFIGQSPTWNVALLQSPAAQALQNLYWQAAPWETFSSDTPGHQAMREALGDVTGSDFYTAGWVWSYPLLRALEAAAEAGNLSREGVVEAFRGLTGVDYEGMLPEGAGNYAAEPGERMVRQTVISAPDPESPSGVSTLEAFFEGPTVQGHDFAEPCINLYED